MSTKQNNIHPFRAAVCDPTQMHNREDLFARDSTGTPSYMGSRLDRVTFDRYATANYKDLYEKKTFFSSI